MEYNSKYTGAQVEALLDRAGAALQKREVVKTLPDNIGYGTSYTLAVKSIELAADKFHIVGRCVGLTLTLP